jgi:hypothetical protein
VPSFLDIEAVLLKSDVILLGFNLTVEQTIIRK